jgi:mutual gliding-motility protein MglA
MAYVDEAAREINVKLVWYSAVPSHATTLLRQVAARTRPDLRQERTLALGGGATVTQLQILPVSTNTLRGYKTRLHLYAIACEGDAVEVDDARRLLFKGADGCVFVAGPGEGEALGRLDAALAAQGYERVSIVCALDGVFTAEATARAVALGFPDRDVLPVDVPTGVGVIEVLKAITRKILRLLANASQPDAGRPTPPPGTQPFD